jgi:transposase InsO family protein
MRSRKTLAEEWRPRLGSWSSRTREQTRGESRSPGILADWSIGGERVSRFLDEAAKAGGLPETITVDNGPEFISNALDRWAYDRGVKLHSSAPGSRLRTRLSNPSTAGCERNVSTLTGLTRSNTPASSLPRGGPTTTPIARTSALGGFSPMEYEEQLRQTQLMA